MPMKRNSSSPVEETEKKKHAPDRQVAVESPAPAIPADIAELDAVQNKINEIDRKCALEQMKVQRQYDAQKKPLFEERAKLAAQVDGFWYTVLSKERLTRYCLSSKDHELLKDHLKEIKVDDNQDDFGSYTVTFVFADTAPFAPTTLVRKVTFNENGEEVEQESLLTKITFSDKTLDPRASLKEGRNESLENFSLFDWFARPSIDQPFWEEFGELIRRQFWNNPIEYFSREEMSESDSDMDDIDDEDEDEEEDEGQEEGGEQEVAAQEKSKSKKRKTN